MKRPDESHPITIDRHEGRVSVRAGDVLLADSANPLVLREASYPPVFYFPPGDVRMEALEATEKTTHCPYKGDAGYYSVTGGGDALENAAWVYREAYPDVAEIAGHIAFYNGKVEIVEG